MRTKSIFWLLTFVVAGLLTPWPSVARAQTFVTSPAPVNSDAGGPGTPDSLAPTVAFGGTGHAVAAWTQFLSSLPLPDVRIHAAHTADAGRSWSTSVVPSGLYGVCNQPAVAVDPNGHAVLVWRYWTGVQGAQSYDYGQTWSAPAHMSGGQGAPRVATDGMGTWIVVSALSGTGTADIACARSADDGQNWTLTPLNTDATWDGYVDAHPRIATDGLGN